MIRLICACLTSSLWMSPQPFLPQPDTVVVLDGTELSLPTAFRLPSKDYFVGPVQIRRPDGPAQQHQSEWRRRHQHSLGSVMANTQLRSTDHSEWKARIEFLRTVQHDDPGFVVDRVVYRRGTMWFQIVDTDHDGVLADEQPVECTDERQRLVGRPIQPLVPLSPPRLPEQASFEDLHSRLQLLDGRHRKNHLKEIVQLSSELIRQTRSEIADTSSSEPSEPQRKQLARLLYSRGRALAYMELPDVVSRHPIANQKEHDRLFEANFQELAALVDTTGRDYFLLHVRRERRMKRYGVALEILRRHLRELPDEYFLAKKRRDLCRLLGWDHLAEQYDGWLRLRHVGRYQPMQARETSTKLN